MHLFLLIFCSSTVHKICSQSQALYMLDSHDITHSFFSCDRSSHEGMMSVSTASCLMLKSTRNLSQCLPISTEKSRCKVVMQFCCHLFFDMIFTPTILQEQASWKATFNALSTDLNEGVPKQVACWMVSSTMTQATYVVQNWLDGFTETILISLFG